MYISEKTVNFLRNSMENTDACATLYRVTLYRTDTSYCPKAVESFIFKELRVAYVFATRWFSDHRGMPVTVDIDVMSVYWNGNVSVSRAQDTPGIPDDGMELVFKGANNVPFSYTVPGWIPPKTIPVFYVRDTCGCSRIITLSRDACEAFTELLPGSKIEERAIGPRGWQ